MKSFRLKLIARVIALSVTLFLMCHQYFSSDDLTTTIIFTIVSVIQIILLIIFIDQTNRELSRFFLSIKYSDFSQTFSNQSLGGSFKELNKAFDEVIQKFQKTRSEKEENFRYLQTIVRHVGIGLLSFDKGGKVELINNAAKRLLDVPHLNNINMLAGVNENLNEILLGLNSGDKKIIKLITKDEVTEFMFYATEFKLKERMFTLVSIQNIQSELEEKEMEAWQKLIRVLTHEIMNSVTPVSSLAGTVETMILQHFEENPSREDEDTINDITGALKIIQRRSDGLINFVDKYRSLTKIPQPNLSSFSINTTFDRIVKLMQTDIEKYNVQVEVKVHPESLKLNADQEQIEQVLLNLFINAVHAVKNQSNPKIELQAFKDHHQRSNIIVKDYGVGITKEVQEKIFIPFFTTKQEGSGIGLSLSRQIIRAHGGTMRVNSVLNEYSSFTIRL